MGTSGNPQPLQHRTALVTGGSRGIGLAIARALAADGCRVALAARSLDALEKAAASLQAAGAEAFAVALDVTDAASIERAVQQVLQRWGRIDVLVNNAGIAESAPLAKLEPELWERTLRTNLTGVYLCTRAVLPGMVAARHGRIINIASVAGKFGFKYVSAYAASKHGVLGFTKSIALEVATQNITVNAVCPGYVESDMTEAGFDRIQQATGISREEARRRLEMASPQQRLFTPEEVAHVVRMLAADEARGINGQAINICGGLSPY